MNIICLSIKAEVDSDKEVSHLIEFVNGLTMKKKALILKLQDLTLEALQNLTLNFEVTVDSMNKGSANFACMLVVKKTGFIYPYLCLT